MGNVYPRSAFKDLIFVFGKINVHVCIGDLLTKTIFHIVENLVVNILLGTSLLDKKINVLSKIVVPCSSEPVSMLAPTTTYADVNVVVTATFEA